MAKVSSSNDISAVHTQVISSRRIVGGRLFRRSARDALENVSVEISRHSNRVQTARKESPIWGSDLPYPRRTSCRNSGNERRRNISGRVKSGEPRQHRYIAFSWGHSAIEPTPGFSTYGPSVSMTVRRQVRSAGHKERICTALSPVNGLREFQSRSSNDRDVSWLHRSGNSVRQHFSAEIENLEILGPRSMPAEAQRLSGDNGTGSMCLGRSHSTRSCRIGTSLSVRFDKTSISLGV
jgi:hypothetical protein